MFVNITASESGTNKGSSGQLVHYLDKEDRLADKDKEKELWFNAEKENIASYQVKHALDNNVAKLCRNDAKFFLINISPSQKEIAFLKEEFGKEEVKDVLKDYASRVMDEYAKNFNRPGIESGDDLLWFGKLEHHRYYTFKDLEVKNGEAKRGETKSGNQMHVQIIVSRKDITNSIKLSPMNNSKGKNKEHSKKLGQFNRLAFKQASEMLFDKIFEFDRQLKETLAYANTKKNGTSVQKEQMRILELGTPQQDSSLHVRRELARQVAKGRFTSVSQMLKNTGKTVDGFLKLMKPKKSLDLRKYLEQELGIKRQTEQGYGKGLGL